MIDNLVSILHSGNHSLVVDNGEIHTFDGRGVSDLYRLLFQDNSFLKDAMVADKVVGKAAAALMIAGGVAVVYADTISRLALDLFDKSDVKVNSGNVVPHIINRAGTGWCPLETRCKDCSTVSECIKEIEGFLSSMRRK